MAYEALSRLQQTVNHILIDDHKNPIILPHKETVSIHDLANVLQSLLDNFPEETNSFEEPIRELADKIEETIKSLLSQGNPSYCRSLEPSDGSSNKLRTLAEKLESTAADVVDYVKSNDLVNSVRHRSDSPAFSSSLRPAPTSEDVVFGFGEDLNDSPAVTPSSSPAPTSKDVVVGFDEDLSDSSAFISTGPAPNAEDVAVGFDEDLRDSPATRPAPTSNNVVVGCDGDLSDSSAVVVVGCDEDLSNFPAVSTSLTSKDVVVGFDDDLIELKGRLLRSDFNLQVLPIVGVGGIGKTTLAKMVYNNASVMEMFEFRAWLTISQEYSVESIVLNLLASMKEIEEEIDVPGENSMESLIRKYLNHRRYLIVMDDICTKKAWDDVKKLFPRNYKQSRIILTTRLRDVAAYANPLSPIHTVRFLDNSQSWHLLQRKVLADQVCPLELVAIGRKIVKNCRGLPLLIVVVAGILSRIPKTRNLWNQIAANDGNLETVMSLSYTHLPDQLKACFLYIGGFPEDYEIRVSELIKLWIAEGFLRCEVEAEECLEDLVERSLVLATSKKSDGRIKSCSLHDIVRDFCIRQGQAEKIHLPVMDYMPTPILRRHFLPQVLKNHRRISATRYDLDLMDSMHASHIHTVICIPQKGCKSVGSVHKFSSLRVLHVLRGNGDLDWEPGQVFDLRYLTYLASNIPPSIVPQTISKLQNLQTLIFYRSKVRLPVQIWSLRQLRHLISSSFHRLPHPQRKALPLENLQTLSLATNLVCSGRMVEMIPNVKKLGICYSKGNTTAGYHLDNLVHLCQLENLKLDKYRTLLKSSLLEWKLEMLEREEWEKVRREEWRCRSEELEKRRWVKWLKSRKRTRREPEKRISHVFRYPRGIVAAWKKHRTLPFSVQRRILSSRFKIFALKTHECIIFGPSMNLVFPPSLKKLTLCGWGLPWRNMSIIGRLPKLQVLKLRNYACSGKCWETLVGEFRELRLLLIDKSHLHHWTTESSHFPRLECLMLHACPFLSGIPVNLGDIPTFKLIEVDNCRTILFNSTKKIQEKQRESGNCSFQVRLKRSLPSYFSAKGKFDRDREHKAVMTLSSQSNWKRSELRFLKPKINIYYKWKIFQWIAKALTSVGGGDLLQQFINGCFGSVFFWRGGNSDTRALQVLMSYEVDSPNPDEIWFLIKDQLVRFTHLDYALVTGLHFGSSEFDPSQGSYDLSGVEVYNRVGCGRPIVLKELLRRFTGLSLHEDAEIPVEDIIGDYLKVANIIALYFFFLGFAESQKVENWAWVLVDDLDAWNRFPWGAYTYGALMHYVSRIPRTSDETLSTYHFYGPVWALQVWAYETMPSLGDAAASIVGPEPEWLPRVMRWKFGTPQEIDFGRIFGVEFYYLDLLPTNLELEQAYWRSTICNAPLGVRFVRVDNPLHPRVLQDGRPLLYRVAREIEQHTRSKRRRTKHASPAAMDEDEPNIQPQSERRRKDRAIALRGAGAGPSVVPPSCQHDQLEIVSKVVGEINETVVPKMLGEMKNFMKSFFRSKRSSNSMSTSRGDDGASSSTRHSVSMNRESSRGAADRESSRHSVSVYREPSRGAADRDPSRHNCSAKTKERRSHLELEVPDQPEPEAHDQYSPEAHHQHYMQPPHYDTEVQSDYRPQPQMQSEHQSFVSAVPLAVLEPPQHPSPRLGMDFFDDSV